MANRNGRALPQSPGAHRGTGVGLAAAPWSDNDRKTGPLSVADSDFGAESDDLVVIGGGGFGCSPDEFGVASGLAMFWELVTAGVEAGKTTTRGFSDWAGDGATSCELITEVEGEGDGDACGASSVFSWLAACFKW
jgi:hypothetical protein